MHAFIGKSARRAHHPTHKSRWSRAMAELQKIAGEVNGTGLVANVVDGFRLSGDSHNSFASTLAKRRYKRFVRGLLRRGSSAR